MTDLHEPDLDEAVDEGLDEPADDEGAELAGLARASLGDDEGEEQDSLIDDEELPSKVVFQGTAFDDVNGIHLKIGDRVRVIVSGRVIEVGDKELTDHVRHVVKVKVESVVEYEG
jgi:hypothetical protein